MRRSEELDLARRALRGRDLVVFSNDWDGDPLSKVHIMRILSRDNRVLWVNSIGNRAPKANAHDVKRIWKKLASFTEGIREVEPNLFVLAPLAIPFYGSEVVRATNRELLRAQVLRAMRKLHFKRPISWSFLPASAPVSGRLGEEFVVYHCVDEFSAFSDTNGRHIAELEETLLRRADLCITSADRLRDNKIRVNPNTVLVRHGVDFNHFVKACDPSTPIPEDIAKLPRPIFGFFGLVADWVDLEAIAATARAHREGSVVVIGKVAPDVDPSVLTAEPNVHMLGRKPYAALPGYCRAFDVALMPFKVNELTLNANPLKVREYLAAGLPVVSSDIPEVRKVGLCKVASSTEDFVRKVDECLADGAGPTRERAERIRHESWEAKVEEIRGFVGEAMVKAGRGL
ncbi:spore coat polysaccharide biosynthesis glycosyltransferase ExoP [Vitiosangium sp. GDMCC 1.1324]|uniref:spore coat polysaccharide biosynthesis glycosyltransferase ExoP n=1 Tax=Vitiosangium sp. (strain GDMCC 1.1324) TaxID=2138576 RepID=UPI000D3896FB|nr:spore coat polysaccharide biosynthesis glycosyltransferase ExoP [Vitiosangium sp. GDMCC 1.1324]PTL77279.1 glycosyltransferase family 1 protein [Vitiosangium sp. GDMCC 1.1324]